MPGNPKDSEWYSTPNEARTRKRLELTLPEKTIAKLERIAKARGQSKSEAVEDMIERTKVKEP